jgi:exodeoxyribonuclease III
MKILSWNIRQGGGSRIDRIQNMIMAHNPEILLLSEFRNNAAGKNLRQWLEGFGHQHQAVPETAEPHNNTVLVSSRSAFQRITFPELELNAHRCVGARFNGLTLLGLYFPIMEAKRPVFAFLKALPHEYLKKESLIVGDLNTGCRYWDEGRMDLSLVEEFGALIGCGWTDVWRTRNPTLREWSWVEPWGQHIGYRIDHALVSPPLVSQVQDVQYSHAERESGVSDHSALALTLNVPAIN